MNKKFKIGNILLPIATWVLIAPHVSQYLLLPFLLIYLYIVAYVSKAEKIYGVLGLLLFISLLFLKVSPFLILYIFLLLTIFFHRIDYLDKYTFTVWSIAVGLLSIPPATNALYLFLPRELMWMGQLAPILFLLFIMAISRLVSLGNLSISIVFSFAISYFCQYYDIYPNYSSILIGLPAVLSVYFAEPKVIKIKLVEILSLIGLFFAGFYFIVSISLVNIPLNIKFWIPNEPHSSGSYYENYEQVLRMSGFKNFSIINNISDIAADDFIVFPYAAHPNFEETIENILNLYYSKSLKIVVVGDHTNLGGVAKSLSYVKSPILLNSDTTIPPLNSDFLGWVGSSGLQVSQNAAINRGASIKSNSVFVIPLLWITGGHLENDISSDGRLGDYLYRDYEYNGPYSIMAAGGGVDAPSWIVFGDNTPFLNEFIAVNPGILAEILVISSGFSLVIYMAFWMNIFILLYYKFNVSRFYILSAILVSFLIPTSSYGLKLLFFNSDMSLTKLQRLYVYGDRSIGKALVKLSDALVTHNVVLEVDTFDYWNKGLDHSISIGHIPSLPKSSECIRAGGLLSGEVKVMDVLSCKLENSESLFSIGTDPIIVKSKNNILVMDKDFIVNAAPEANIDWLKKQIENLRAGNSGK